jgi:hypothetical protein
LQFFDLGKKLKNRYKKFSLQQADRNGNRNEVGSTEGFYWAVVVALTYMHWALRGGS